ncbi:uncharacterized protein LOC118510854 [Anopheles stephensi]|uniref:uncharacterized protein LOC118510854 n=1 Tax=Anopheles stephensi TaxID=30069 RepID=UPI001658BEEB|nr:uncharacterized protein LOC118510854 [Anopheles stephensi]
MRDETEPRTAIPKATQHQQSSSTTVGSDPSQNNDSQELQLENKGLKRKIEELELALSVKCFDTAHVKALVEPFSGNGTLTVHRWFEKLENAFQLLKLNKEQQLVAACDLLIETAAVFRRTIPLTGYDDFKAKMIQEFADQGFSDETIFEKLRAHKLGVNSLLRYVTEMVDLAQSYNISEVDLVDIIIDGFEDDSPTIVMLYGVKTIAELKSLLPRYEKRLDKMQANETKKKQKQSLNQHRF